jgi:hypothetical protein
MQGGKNWILPKVMNANPFFSDSHWLEKPLMSLYGTEWRERGYGLTEILVNKCDVLMPQHFIKPRLIDRRHNVIFLILISFR